MAFDPLTLLGGISPQSVLNVFTTTDFIILNPNAQPIQNCHRACTSGASGGTGAVAPGASHGGETQPKPTPGGTSAAAGTAASAKRCKIESRRVASIVDIRTVGLGLIERGRCALDMQMFWDGCSVTAIVLPGDGSYAGLLSGIKYGVNIYSAQDLDGVTGCASCCDECCCVVFTVMVTVSGLLTSSQFFTKSFRVCGNGNWDPL